MTCTVRNGGARMTDYLITRSQIVPEHCTLVERATRTALQAYAVKTNLPTCAHADRTCRRGQSHTRPSAQLHQPT